MRICRATAVCLASVLLVVAVAGCNDEPARAGVRKVTVPPGEAWLTEAQVKEAKIETAPLELENVDDTILTGGKVTFDDSKVTLVFSPVSGRVTRIEVPLGQRVHTGDVLAVIESPDIGVASSDMEKAQADLEAAERDFKRQEQLYAVHASSQKDYDEALDAYRKAKAELDRARQKGRLLTTDAVDVVTQTYTLRAGIDGEVIMRTINPGMEVQGQYGGGNAPELFTIGDIGTVWVLADVYEMDLARVKPGARVLVSLFSEPGRPREGTVDWVSDVLDPTTRTDKVRCRFDNADGALKPEMYVTVQVTVRERQALAIPRSALLRLGDQTCVFVERGTAPDGRTRYERVPVQVDDEGGGHQWVPVVQGLNAGDRIVTTGGILLAGMV